MEALSIALADNILRAGGRWLWILHNGEREPRILDIAHSFIVLRRLSSEEVSAGSLTPVDSLWSAIAPDGYTTELKINVRKSGSSFRSETWCNIKSNH